MFSTLFQSIQTVRQAPAFLIGQETYHRGRENRKRERYLAGAKIKEYQKMFLMKNENLSGLRQLRADVAWAADDIDQYADDLRI